VSISPDGVRGFEGGGNPLTTAQVDPVKKLAHVSSVQETLSDRLTSSNTNLQSSINPGSLGKRFAGNSGQTFSFGGSGGGENRDNGNVSFTPPVTVVGTNDPSDPVSNDGQTSSFKLT